MKVENKVIVVTGAGDGVGRQVCLQLLQKGAIVVGIDNNPERLATTKEMCGAGAFEDYLVDVADRQAVGELAQKVVAGHGRVDGLINDAGIIQPFVDISALSFELIERVMNVNFYGQLNTIKAFLPLLLEQEEAQILNISSMGGFLPVPGQTAYGASKAAVILLTGGLRSELRRTKVGVALVIPGSMNTNISQNSGVPVAPGVADSPLAKILLSPEKAARIVIKSFERNKRVTYMGKDSKLFHCLYNVTPPVAVTLINKALSLKP